MAAADIGGWALAAFKDPIISNESVRCLHFTPSQPLALDLLTLPPPTLYQHHAGADMKVATGWTTPLSISKTLSAILNESVEVDAIDLEEAWMELRKNSPGYEEIWLNIYTAEEWGPYRDIETSGRVLLHTTTLESSLRTWGKSLIKGRLGQALRR